MAGGSVAFEEGERKGEAGGDEKRREDAGGEDQGRYTRPAAAGAPQKRRSTSSCSQKIQLYAAASAQELFPQPDPNDHLVGIDMSNMGLHTISETVGAFRSITTLLVANNNLTRLPAVICTNLTHLTHMDFSYNRISSIPPEVEDLRSLETLIINHNLLSEIPRELGRLWKLQTLSISGNPVVSPPVQVLQQGTQSIVAYLRDRVPPVPPPSERGWLTFVEPEAGAPEGSRLKVLTYNVLAESYATQDRHMYTPCWALSWDYRSQRVLSQLQQSDADIMCLQEVEAQQFSELFKPKLAELGYAGVHKPKSRARTMEDWGCVDGCAIFFKKERFQMVDEVLIEYQSLSLEHFSELTGDRRGMERVMSKDNIAVALVLQFVQPLPQTEAPGARRRNQAPQPRRLVVCNTHIHWDPSMPDVKLVQAQFLMEELAKICIKFREPTMPLIVAGDFNSEPDSGVYQLLSEGDVPGDHEDCKEYNYGVYSKEGFHHDLKLNSSFALINEPPFTNYNGDFIGVLDYIWFTPQSLRVLGVLEPIGMDEIRAQKSPLPNAHFPSDHICTVAEFEVLSAQQKHEHQQQQRAQRNASSGGGHHDRRTRNR